MKCSFNRVFLHVVLQMVVNKNLERKGPYFRLHRYLGVVGTMVLVSFVHNGRIW